MSLNTALILHKQLRRCCKRGRGREAEGNGYSTSIVLFWPFLGRMDKGYGQGDTSPKQLSGHHLDTGSLPPLDCTEHSRVGLAGATGTACFPPSELKGTCMHPLPKQEPGFLKSQLPQPLAVLTYTMRLAPSLHCFVYKAIIFISIYTIATSVLT